MITKEDIPVVVREVTDALIGAGFEAFLVGGCVRDIMLDKMPKDWDVTTNAHPDQIVALFPETYVNNDYGTVGVVTDSPDERLKVVEVTPYRTESEYSDARRPDSVSFGVSLAEDLARRDFTINAIAINADTIEVVDLYNGVQDIKDGMLKAVRNPKERFNEDALRMLRAIRLTVEHKLTIENNTMLAISACADNLAKISKERIRDELTRIINSDEPMQGIIFLDKLGLLKYVLPEIAEGIGCGQNQAHAFDVYEHNLRSLQHAADKKMSFVLRIAALLHDVGKPRSREFSPHKNDWTFYSHEVIGAKMAKKILDELKFPRDTRDVVVKLVRWHMFFSDPDQITLAAVRRTIRNVGAENINDLLSLRMCDRIGTGRPKEQPFRFRVYQSMVDEAMRDPVSVKMLKIDGGRIMKISGQKPGPKIGFTLHALLEEVLDDPTKNTEDYLDARAEMMMTLDEDELEKLGESGKDKREELEQQELREIKRSRKVG